MKFLAMDVCRVYSAKILFLLVRYRLILGAQLLIQRNI